MQFFARHILYVICKGQNESQRLWLVRQRSWTGFARRRGRRPAECRRAQQLRRNNYRLLRLLGDVIRRSVQGAHRKDPQFAFGARQERAATRGNRTVDRRRRRRRVNCPRHLHQIRMRPHVSNRVPALFISDQEQKILESQLTLL